MALVESNFFPIGALAPSFTLLDTANGKKASLDELKGNEGTVVFFICNHCPYVKHVNQELVQLARDYASSGIGFIAISANDSVAYPQDGPEEMKMAAQQLSYPFPYLFDESQSTAKAYDAACTPDFYVFDKDLKCTYHGELDRSRPGNDIPVSGASIRAAIDGVLANQPPLSNQVPSIGCSIKWK